MLSLAFEPLVHAIFHLGPSLLAVLADFNLVVSKGDGSGIDPAMPNSIIGMDCLL